MRRTCLDQIYEIAKRDERVFFIGSDLGYGTLSKFKSEMPDRFLMEGIFEANIIGIAAGLAMNGKIPYVNTIASFITRRCFEQILIDACLHNQNIRFIGNGGGLVYAPLGPTHLAIEDLSIMRAIPNMTVIAPCDAEEMKRLIPATLNYDGPIYIRLGKGGDPIVSLEKKRFQIGRGICLKDGEDALIITTGVMAKICLDAAVMLDDQTIDTGVLHLHTIKPLDKEMILHHLEKVRVVITVEENNILGGLGSAVAELIAETGFKKNYIFKRFGIKDRFPDDYGSQAWQWEKLGITAMELFKSISGAIQTIFEGDRRKPE